MAKFFINRPIFAIVISIIIVLAGSISMYSLPVGQYPQITPPQVTVSGSYNGANAQTVEQSVAQVIEQQVNGVEGAVSLQSTSTDNGTYTLNVKFELEKDGDLAAMQTQNQVGWANSQLPNDVLNAGLVTKKQAPDTVMYFSLWAPNGDYDNVFLKNYGSINIVDALKRVKGVSNVNEYGSDYAMRIWVRPDKLAQLGITVNDIGAAIQAQNVQAPAGKIGQRPTGPNQDFQYTVNVKGRLVDPEEFANIVVRAQPDGSFVRIGDVARVELGGKDYSFSSDLKGRDSVTFAVQLTPDANALDTVSAAKQVIEEASKKFPAGMEYKIVVDNTRFVRESLHEVAITFVEALLLVMIIVFLFLQTWRATLIPLLAVPVSLIGTFASFVLLGFTINTLTLFAMVLAIGLVVDDAIVVVEAVEHHMRNSKMSPYDATVQAMSEVSGPVVAIAAVLASVFIPVAFFGGTVGVLYKQFAITIAVSMALSAIVALSLTPALCVMLLKPHVEEGHPGVLGRFFAGFNHGFDRLVERYSAGVQKAIRRSAITIICLLVLVVLSGGIFKNLPSSFVPSEDQGFMFSAITLPEAANPNRTRKVAEDIAAQIREMPGVETTLAITGYDILAGAPKPNAALLITALKPWSDRPTAALSVDAKIRDVFRLTANIPEASAITLNVPTLPGIGSVGGVTMMIEDKGGGTVADMDAISKQFVAAARKRPEFAMINSSFQANTPGYQFEVDRDKAEKLGVALPDVYQALQAFLGGWQVNDFNDFGRIYKVVMQAEPQFRSDVNDMRFLFVRSNSGTMVPLNTLIKPVETSAPTSLKRFNGFRAIQINASPAQGYSSGQAMDALESVAKEVLPSTYAYEWADQSREEKLSGGRAPIIFGFALVFVFLCLAALYESWRIPFAVILSVPTGLFGAMLLTYARHLELNVYMQIGLVVLIGLAAKNAILIVEFAKMRTDHGMEPVQAAIEAAKLRLRPIIMTSFAFILGSIPLAIAAGAGSAARIAMGTAVVGGMVTATMFGIFIVPVLFVVIEKFGLRKKKNLEPKTLAQ
ncbi:MAG: multidrug efflux RND transporter permease subunit [Sporomusaceae bacterium]|nr:multidrug efflux RND transporter permease subunit [Sporomusaceae bacterium]